MWSSWSWVSRIASRRLTPARASARRSADPLGPVSTRTADLPSRNRIASPCPTSSTVIVGSLATSGPRATSTTTRRDATAATRGRHDLGWGQALHRSGSERAHTIVSTSTHRSAKTAADGSAARCVAMSTESAHAAPAARSNKVPSHPHADATMSPRTPTTRASAMSGPARMLASGETSDTTPNVRATRGNVAA